MIKIVPKQYQFKRPAGTSRGVYTTREVWYLQVSLPQFPGRVGVGECAPLIDLSCDYTPRYAEKLADLCRKVDEADCFPVELFSPVMLASTEKPVSFASNMALESEKSAPLASSMALEPATVGCQLLRAVPELLNYPSVLFGLETAYHHLLSGTKYTFFNTPFARGEAGIPINGLIWMGDYTYMQEQIDAKLAAGYRCIKLKIGAIDFEQELSLLQQIRARYSKEVVELRVDANGAFAPTDALEKLQRLSQLNLHSIEQPIRAGQWEQMARLAEASPLPIALDEELIGCNCLEDKRRLLDTIRGLEEERRRANTIRPVYIVLKPSLHGGICGCAEWIREAEARGIGWWITSALETNIGLNAIAQWCGTLNCGIPQGLGTGLLFTENVDVPLEIKGDCLWYAASGGI